LGCPSTTSDDRSQLIGTVAEVLRHRAKTDASRSHGM
jgi:hypothetical protein